MMWYWAEMRPKSLEEMKEFVKATKLPFVVKGVLSVKDAEKMSGSRGKGDCGIPPSRNYRLCGSPADDPT